MNRASLIFLLLLGSSLPAAAYVEPGVWASAFQVLYFALLTVLAFLGGPLKAVLARLGWRKPKGGRDETGLGQPE